MYSYDIEVRSANPNQPLKTNSDDLINLIRNEIRRCNASQKFKAQGKRIELKSVNRDYLILTLSSKASLENPTLSLRGLSRALVKTGAFDEYIYGSSLFNSVLLSSDENEKVLDDIEAVQEAVYIFMSNLKEDAEVKEKMREILSEHRSNRLR